MDSNNSWWEFFERPIKDESVWGDFIIPDFETLIDREKSRLKTNLPALFIERIIKS